MRKCPWCAEQIQDRARICRYCQRSVLEENPPASELQPRAAPLKTPLARFLLAGLAVTALLVLLFHWGSRRPATEQTIDNSQEPSREAGASPASVLGVWTNGSVNEETGDVFGHVVEIVEEEGAIVGLWTVAQGEPGPERKATVTVRGDSVIILAQATASGPRAVAAGAINVWQIRGVLRDTILSGEYTYLDYDDYDATRYNPPSRTQEEVVLTRWSPPSAVPPPDAPGAGTFVNDGYMSSRLRITSSSVELQALSLACHYSTSAPLAGALGFPLLCNNGTTMWLVGHFVEPDDTWQVGTGPSEAAAQRELANAPTVFTRAQTPD